MNEPATFPADLTELAETPEECRFFAKVKRDGTCWMWTAARQPRGYGGFRLNGKTERAHRVLYKWMFGEESCEGLDLDHLCRQTSCVNPFHLEPVTHAENVRRGITGLYPHGHRTHCDHGHPFDEENTGRRSDGAGRFCRTCRREATARYRARNEDLIRKRNRDAKRKAREDAGVPARYPDRTLPRNRA